MKNNPSPKSGGDDSALREGSAVTWWRRKWRIGRFSIVFLLLMGFYYGLALTPWFDQMFFSPYLNMNARLSGSILNGMGERCQVTGTSVYSPKFKMEIRRGCDAVEPSWLFCTVMLAFPAPFSRKLIGMIAGILFLQVLNLMRIVSLYFIGIHYQTFFNTAHLEIWPMIFILAALILWVGWIRWTREQNDQLLGNADV